MKLDDLQAVASVLSSVCAVVAATVSVLVWRKARTSDLSEKIENGDRAARKHAERSAEEIKQSLGAQAKRLDELEDSMARVESAQRHHLMARDLGPLHEKVNALAREQAATSATTKAIHEQVRMIQNLLMRRDP